MQISLQSLLGFFSGVTGFISIIKTRAHVLSILLSLELISLSIFLILNSSNLCTSLAFSSMYLIIVAVGEGTIGLALLTYLVSVHSSGYTKSFSLP